MSLPEGVTLYRHVNTGDAEVYTLSTDKREVRVVISNVEKAVAPDAGVLFQDKLSRALKELV